MPSDSSGSQKRILHLRNDGSHRELEAFDDLFDAPSTYFARGQPALLEKLGELDDVVFEAIAGRVAALDRLRTLWPEATAAVGPELAEESREAYLRHAMAKWEECAQAEPERNPRIAVTLMEVLTILLQS